MSPSEDKLWVIKASKYLLDPLTAPLPHQETGPGSHSSSTTGTAKEPSVNTYPTPPTPASPSRSTSHPTNPYSPTNRQQASSAYANEGPSHGRGSDKPASEGRAAGRRRGSSLGERFPGDMSHRPLEVLRREAKAADRAPHLKKMHIPCADLIDSLDRSFGGAYHHEGPYDATLLARNISSEISPVAAVEETNAETLRATPREHVRDALDKHMPLHGTAVIPPGGYDLLGQEMDYEEGADLMREDDAEGGAYKRWSGMKYHPDDLKGKGEPWFLIERALKGHESGAKPHRRVTSDRNSVSEVQTRSGTTGRQRSASGNSTSLANSPIIDSQTVMSQISMGRSNTTGRRVGEGLKRRFGSIRRSKKNPTDA